MSSPDPTPWRDQLSKALCAAAISVFAVFASTASTQAEMISGSEIPEFRDALASWLDGDDLASVPRLAALAQEEENIAARNLLGLIDKRASLQGPDLVALSREERIALLRAPGGISGRNWISHIVEESELARLWESLWQLRGGTEIAERFAELGEMRAARETLLVLISRFETGFNSELRTQSWYPESLMHLTETRTYDPAEADQRPPGDPIRRFAGLTVAEEELKDWLSLSPYALPLRAACAQKCPETKEQCTLALYLALDGYSTLLLLGSPIAALIPEPEFAQSQRSINAVARRIMLKHSARTRQSLLRQTDRIDECAVSWLREEFQRYYPKPRETPTVSD